MRPGEPEIEEGPPPQSVTLADARRISVRVSDGAGEPLVLLHGLLDSALGWAWLAAHSDRPVIAVDLPGFGRSDMPRHPRLDAYADDVLATLDRLGVQRCVLVGHSFGGGIAAELADRAPARVATLVLLAPAGFGRIRLAEAVSLPGIRTIAARGLPPAVGNLRVVTTAYLGRAAMSQPVTPRIARPAAAPAPGALHATDAVVTAGRSATAMHRRRLRYVGPAHVLWGDRDRVVPRSHVDGVLLGLPHAVVEVWAGMGHNPQRERRPELAAYLERAACGRGIDPADLPNAA